jgi:hypothetical protein
MPLGWEIPLAMCHFGNMLVGTAIHASYLPDGQQ